MIRSPGFDLLKTDNHLSQHEKKINDLLVTTALEFQKSFPKHGQMELIVAGLLAAKRAARMLPPAE